MLYLVFIGLLYITKVSAQSCEYNTESACENAGCVWNRDNDELCESPDAGFDCCFEETTTTTTTPSPTTPSPTTPAPTTPSPTLAPTCPVEDTCEAQWVSRECCIGAGCDWTADDDSDSVCGTVDASFRDNCCIDTPAPTTPEPTTPAPTTPSPTTPSPTTYECPTTFTSCEALRSDECCLDFDRCRWLPDDKELCDSVDASAGECCVLQTPSPTTPAPTTPAPTTPEPTTPAPTTPEPTTPAPTTPEPTTPAPTTPSPTRRVTPEPTTPAPTTPSPTRKVTPSPTTPSPTRKVTPSPTTPSPTKKQETPSPVTPEPTKETETTSWGQRLPTKPPTQPSAMKWEMIHPAYKGSDGELLWHVYYGDFSDDARFDSFRKAEKWDANEIRPIINSESKFRKYQMNKEQAIVTDHASNSQSYGKYLIGISAVLIILFAVWYKYKDAGSKREYVPLLQEEKVQYGQ